ncbi:MULTISPECIES: hypothetical protein [unclassified Saccharothrix]|uniref:hypothetical protein n=1 Tax=unclassified Saccharothrix TaxID=2593673 RepID=UPI00307CF93A
MVVTVPDEVADRTWSPVLDGLHAAELDCLQANLAAVADRHHGGGAHVALGAAPRLRPAFPPDGPPSLDVPVETRLAEASRLLGLSVAVREDGLDGPALRRLAAVSGPLYVVGDAHTMPWVPYFGQKHMEHSFLLTESGVVVDAYHNDTPWGSARPGVWRVADLDAAVPKSSAFVLSAGPLPPSDVDRELVATARAAGGELVDRYVAAVREHSDRPAGWDALVLDVWLLARTRALHARWLAASGVDDGGRAAEGARAWLTLASQTYVAMRRAQRGGGMPSALVDRVHELLLADAALDAELAAEAVRSTVVGALASVLDVESSVVAGPLRELPKFNSFRLVDVIERVESALEVELDPDDLATSDLRDVDALTGLFRRAVDRP